MTNQENSNSVLLWNKYYDINKTEYIDLSNVEGNIPSDIGKLKNLLYLKIRGKNIKGTIPNSIGYLKKNYYYRFCFLWSQRFDSKFNWKSKKIKNF